MRKLNLFRFVYVSILSGVLVAALIMPFAGLAGLTAKGGTDSFNELPGELSLIDLPETSFLYTMDGVPITTFFEQNRVPVALSKISKHMQDAIITSEDSRFYSHDGYDIKGIVRAFVSNQNDGDTQGASTLTQQYVRNMLIAAAKTEAERNKATERTALRKIKEIKYATDIERRFSKDEILERYLNIAFFGNNSYGIYAAAQRYFSVLPHQLTLAQSAMLAGLVKSPTAYNPARKSKSTAAKDRRDYILQRMVELKYISQAEADATKKQVIKLNPADLQGSCAAGRKDFGFYCAWFVSWWKSNPAFGDNPDERLKNLKEGGYRITTALDSGMQLAAQKAADSKVSRNNRFATGAVLIEPGTGRVKAMTITRTYSLKKNPGGKDYPNTVNPLLTGSEISPGYQAGSTFKLFTMTAAIRQGMPLSTQINSPDGYTTIYKTQGSASCGGRYCVHNASPRMAGTHTMWSGFGESVNTFFIQLQQKTTVKSAVNTAQDLGIVFRDSVDKRNRDIVQKWPNGEWGSFTLGTALVPPLDMANAYATIAARGRKCEPSPVYKIVDRNGLWQKSSNPTCKQVIPQDVADAVADAAHCPVNDPAAGKCATGNGPTAASVSREIDRPISGKTGTTDSNHSAWFVGFTPNLAAASFFVDPDAPQTSAVPNTKVPIEVFKASMKVALKKLPVVKFVPPTKKRVGSVPVPAKVKPASAKPAKKVIIRPASLVNAPVTSLPAAMQRTEERRRTGRGSNGGNSGRH